MTIYLANYRFTSTCITYYKSLSKSEAIDRLEKLDKPARKTLKKLLSSKIITNKSCIHLTQELGRVETPERQVPLVESLKKNLHYLAAKKLHTLLNHFPLLLDTRLSYLPKDILLIILGKMAPSKFSELPKCMEVMHFMSPKYSSFIPSNGALTSWLSRMNFPTTDFIGSGISDAHLTELYRKNPNCHILSIPEQLDQNDMQTIISMHKSLRSLTIQPTLLSLFLNFSEIEEIVLQSGCLHRGIISELEGFKSLRKLTIQNCMGYTDQIAEKLEKLNLETLIIKSCFR